MLAAGGTGGHIFPAIAVGQKLREIGWTPYIITDRRGKGMIPQDYPCLTIAAASPIAPNMFVRLGRLSRIGIGLISAMSVIAFKRPRLMIGFGGYPAVAPVIAARVLRCPVMLHEQNATLGRANRFLLRFANHLAISWPRSFDQSTTPKITTSVTGTPVREAFHEIGKTAYVPPAETGAINLLIIGGSLGAEVFGKTVPEAICRFPPELKSRLRITHQVRAEQTELVKTRYDGDNIDAEIKTFITDMPEAMAKAHLVICRAGASSVAELVAAGRPALLVPYPHATDDHQTANAKTIDNIGGGWLTPEHEMSAGSLGGKIATLVTDPARLNTAAINIRQLATSDSAKHLAETAIAMIGAKVAA